MMSFRKISANSIGRLVMAYFTEGRPEQEKRPKAELAERPDSGGRLTAYYTGRDTRAEWRKDMAVDIASELGIDPHKVPKGAELARLFEAKRADTSEAWTGFKREISAYDLTIAPHKSVTLAAEFAGSQAEAAAIRHAIMLANDATMRFVARELGWARKGRHGMDGADPGSVGWVSFYHHTARPTLHVEDAATGATYLADVPIPGDPHEHIHNALFNIVKTEDGRVGSLDTQRLHERVHEFGAYFQARLAQHLRDYGIRTGFDKKEEAVVLSRIPEQAVDTFSKGRRQVERGAKAYAKRQGLDWNALSFGQKTSFMQGAAIAARLRKDPNLSEREIWRDQADAIGWQHDTVFEGEEAPMLTDQQRHEQAYAFADRHLAREFRTAAVIDHDKVRLYATRGLIPHGIKGPHDIDEVVGIIEQRGIQIRGQQEDLIVGVVDKKLRVTNTAQIRIEESLLARAKAAGRRHAGALPDEAITDAIAASGLDFASEPEHAAAQIAAIYALGRGADLSVLIGVAGAGKTTLLKPLVDAYHQQGREVIGVATAWRQADALKEIGIERDAAGQRKKLADPEAFKAAGIGGTYALTRFLRMVNDGEITVSGKTVLIVDEISQIAPRPFLKLLDLQARTGMVIKGLGDPEQVQTIEAGDTIRLLKEVLPKESLPEIRTTIRQDTMRAREIAGMFRQGDAAEALALKREDSTARLIGGDHGQVVDRIAEFYLDRRDARLASGAPRGITISTLTNEDAAEISKAVRTRLQARGEISREEVLYKAIDQRGETYDLPVAIGDRVRLFRKTWARIDGKPDFIGSNGDIVTILERTGDGLTLRNANGKQAHVRWDRLTDPKTGRLFLGFGHALTIDSAQGITSDEHINALPRGTAGATAFKMYVAESRHVRQAYTLIAEAAVLEAVKMRQALGNIKPITVEHLWDQIAADMSQKPYKAIGIDLLRDKARIGYEHEMTEFLKIRQNAEAMEQAGRDLNAEFHQRQRDEAARQALGPQIEALAGTIERKGEAIEIMREELLPVMENLVEGYAAVKGRVAEIAEARRAELHKVQAERKVPLAKPVENAEVAIAAVIATEGAARLAPQPSAGPAPVIAPEPSPAPTRRSGPRMG